MTDTETLAHTPDWYDGEVRREDAPEDVQEAFVNMRKAGLVTVEGESCCGSCASADAAPVAEEEDALGYAVFNEQSVQSSPNMMPVYSDFYVGFGSARDDIPVAAIAGIVIEALVDAGAEYEWDGTSSMAVKAVFDA